MRMSFHQSPEGESPYEPPPQLILLILLILSGKMMRFAHSGLPSRQGLVACNAELFLRDGPIHLVPLDARAKGIQRGTFSYCLVTSRRLRPSDNLRLAVSHDSRRLRS